MHDYIDAVYDLTIAYKDAHEDVLPRKTAKSMPSKWLMPPQGNRDHRTGYYMHGYTLNTYCNVSVEQSTVWSWSN